MATPNRAARRRAERTQTALTPEAEQQQLQARINQAISVEQQKTTTALASLDRANRDLGLLENEVTNVRQQVVGFAQQLEESDRELDEALALIGELLTTEGQADELRMRAQGFLNRLLEPEAAAVAEETVTPIDRKKRKPKAGTTAATKVDAPTV